MRLLGKICSQLKPAATTIEPSHVTLEKQLDLKSFNN